MIPEFVFGIPLFNSKECIRYIIKKLMDEGFMVIYTHPNLLYISLICAELNLRLGYGRARR